MYWLLPSSLWARYSLFIDLEQVTFFQNICTRDWKIPFVSCTVQAQHNIGSRVRKVCMRTCVCVCVCLCVCLCVSGTHSCCSGSQDSTWRPDGSASSFGGSWGSVREPAEGCGSSCPRCTPGHCCTDTPAGDNGHLLNMWKIYTFVCFWTEMRVHCTYSSTHGWG